MPEAQDFWLIYSISLLGLGCLSGILAGMFGVGGGIILVPGMIILFHLHPITAWPVHVAVATSLTNIIFTGGRSAHSHHRRGNVDWQIVKILGPGIALGAFLGALLAKQMDTQTLQIFFAAMLLVISAILACQQVTLLQKLPSRLANITCSGGIGIVSSLLGIGGGSLVVPYLTLCNVPVLRAIGCAAALGMAVAIPGALGFALFGWNRPELPPLSIGFIWLPGLVLTLISSVLVAPVGSYFASIMPAKTLRRLLAVFLMIVSIKLALDA